MREPSPCPGPPPSWTPVPTTHRLDVLELDDARLQQDLRTAEDFNYSRSYGEFSFGMMRTTMLANRTGSMAEKLLADYTGTARPTDHGRALPYVSDLMERLFDLRYLKYARLLNLMPGSILMPHRDFIELDSRMFRIHIPLQTDENCASLQNGTVYRMRRGEMWHLDASRTHSAVSYSVTERVHLICDFTADRLFDVLRSEPTAPDPGIPEGNIVARPPLTDEDRRRLLHLGEVIDERNYGEIVAILIRRVYTHDIPGEEVFDLIKQITAVSGNPELIERAARNEEYYLHAR